MKADTYREHLTDLQVEVEELRAKLKEAQTGDLISRQAVMDALTEYWQGISDRHPTLDGEMAVYADCKGIIKRLPSAQPEQRWIPCIERLPNREEYIKNNGLFNVSDGNRSYSEWFDIRDKQRFGEPTMSGFRVDYAVIAWMPLPESYAERQEE